MKIYQLHMWSDKVMRLDAVGVKNWWPERKKKNWWNRSTASAAGADRWHAQRSVHDAASVICHNEERLSYYRSGRPIDSMATAFEATFPPSSVRSLPTISSLLRRNNNWLDLKDVIVALSLPSRCLFRAGWLYFCAHSSAELPLPDANGFQVAPAAVYTRPSPFCFSFSFGKVKQKTW